MIRRQVAEDETDGGHVLQTVIAIGWIVERSRFIDDAYRGFVRGNPNLLDSFKSVTNLLVQPQGAFHRGLSVKLRRIGNLEKNVLHHVGAEGPAQLEWSAVKQHVIEAPLFSRQRRRIADLAAHCHERETYSSAGGIAGRPGFARAGIGRMTV